MLGADEGAPGAPGLRVPHFAVERRRLEAALDQVQPGGVGLVVAPAGSGKSVLLGQWMSRTPGAVFLRVVPAHDDPVVFARALVAALHQVHPDLDTGVADLVAAAGPSMGAVFTSRLLVELETLEHEVVVVLDDLHALPTGGIGVDLDDLVDRLPDNVRLVVGARWDPPLRLQKLRIEGRLVEVRASDLSFDPGECRSLVEAVAGRRLTEGQVDALVEQTDGWAVGLQLAAITLQRATDVDRFLSQFSGSDQLVAEYLSEEVLDELEPDVRRFLLRTSILAWLEPGLCDAVTGDGDAEEVLRLLDRRSLFLIHPAGGGERLRYHHLFAALLHDRFRVAHPEEERDCRRRAAGFLLGAGHVAEAIEQLLAAGEPDAVLDVIVEHGQSFFEQEQAATLARWLRAAHEQDDAPSTTLELNLLAAEIASHQTDAAMEGYRRLRGRGDLDQGEIASAAALYACLGMDDLPSAAVRTAASEAISILETFDPAIPVDLLGVGGRDTVEVLAQSMDAIALLFDGELEQSARRFEAVLSLPGAQYRVWRLHVLGGLALSRALAGRHTEAVASASAALEAAEASGIGVHVAAAFAHFACAVSALDQQRPDDLVFHLHEAGTRAQRTGRTAALALHRALRVERLAFTDGSAAALAALRAATRGAVEPAVVVDLTRAQEVRLLVAEGNLAQARAVVRRGPVGPELRPVVVDLELAAGDVAAARGVLATTEVAGCDVRLTVERMLSEASVLVAEGHAAAATTMLREALEVAELEQLRRPFLQRPAALRLVRIEAQRGSQAFARSVVAAGTPARSADGGAGVLVEPLTDREREVLDYLPTRLSNADVAAALYISVNTLKSHLRHIYSKLAVSDRDEAVLRASDLGLL